MKMIWAIVRHEKASETIASLEKAGFYAYTRMDVMGRGRQKGLSVGSARYEELPKAGFMLVVEDDQVQRALDTLRISARTGNPGDGKIYVSALDQVYSVRTATRETEPAL